MILTVVDFWKEPNLITGARLLGPFLPAVGCSTEAATDHGKSGSVNLASFGSCLLAEILCFTLLMTLSLLLELNRQLLKDSFRFSSPNEAERSRENLWQDKLRPSYRNIPHVVRAHCNIEVDAALSLAADAYAFSQTAHNGKSNSTAPGVDRFSQCLNEEICERVTDNNASLG
ncbi:hypothetical protein HIM_06585 [Hirsutella minnesotensis 3608]|uniref:Uncharacterized protein n=1 Tax=Hirsutella minnesotensis 3608 TaxID=1043627 RepID=A0A0F7ZZB2_9HYPO|nr:hypothetical protein HIM_06585 [Hirsutella minnesotensis 3608]